MSINLNSAPRFAIFAVLLSSFNCLPSFADDKPLNGSASQVQSMSSSVKLTRTPEVVPPKIKSVPLTPVNSYLRITSVDPNAVVPQFNRVRALGPDGKPAVVRPVTPPAILNATAQQTGESGAGDGGSQTNSGQSGITNLAPQSKAINNEANRTGQQASAQAANWQMKSKAKLLTQPLQSQKRSVSWNEWYKRIAKTVYDQWVVNETGPGKVFVQVTVWSTRNIEGRIMRFENAPDAKRTSTQQVTFANAALQAVNSLENNEILEFPANDRRTKVVFELDISRFVGGASGCQVVNQDK